MPDPTDFEEFPVFGDNSTKEKPGDQKYAAGFVPGDVLPAEWLNWFLNTMSKGYNDLVDNALNLVNLIYPVGSIYMSVNNVSPATFLGGTWEQIQDTFLLAAGSTYTAGSTGGEATHTLTENEIPQHNHGEKSLTGKAEFRRGSSSSTATVGDIFGGCSGIFSADPESGSSVAGMVQIFSRTHNRDKLQIDATHIHANFGGGGAHNNMPPYLAVYVWKRTA